MTTEDELRELIALGDKATPRPWETYLQYNIGNGDRGIASCGGFNNTSDEPPYDENMANRDYILTAANLAPEIAAELIAAREEIQRLRVALESLRITSHTECEDCWYSCPKSDDYCGTDDREHCACGMDKQNAIIDAALNGGDL